MKENQQMSDARWGSLEAKIRGLTVTQLHEWTDTGSVLRGQETGVPSLRHAGRTA